MAMAIQDRIDRGETPEHARRAAIREFGNVLLVKDVVSETWKWGWLDRCVQDLRYAARQLRKSPGFAITVVLIVALAVGANTTIFSLAYALILRSLPVPHPEQLVQLQMSRLSEEPGPYLTSALYSEVKEQQGVFAGLCAWQGYWFTGEQNGDGRVVSAATVSGDCFATLQLTPATGRLLGPEDDRAGAQTAVISYAYWTKRFSRDPGVIGKHVVMLNPFSEATPLTIVGVLPASFQSVQVGSTPNVFIPLGDKRDNFNQNVFIFGRLQRGVSLRQAQEQVAPGFVAWNASLAAKDRPEKNARLVVIASRAGYSGLGVEYRKPLMLLQALVVTLLLASSAYLGTLLTARTIVRRREFALRAALGASRARLIRQSFSECLLLALAGGLVGVFLAWMAGSFLLTFVQFDPDSSPIAVGPERDVLLFTLCITMLSVMLWGLIPAFRASRVSILADMRNSSGLLASGRSQINIGRWLVPMQVALSLLIVVVAGLLSTTLVRLISQNNGYRLRGPVFVSTDFPFAFGKEAATKISAELQLQRSVLDRLNHTPGIAAASLGMVHVLGGANYLNMFRASPANDDRDFALKSQTNMNYIAPRYFEVMGTRLLRGRDFSVSDTASSQPVCILTLAAERRFFPHMDAVGRTLYEPQGKEEVKARTVVGVVDDMRYNDLRTDAPPIVYLDFTQMDEARNMEFVIKANDPLAAVADVRNVLRTMAPGVHVTHTITMEEQVGRSLSKERLMATLSNFFAGLGLVLGAVSLYGVLSYSVSRRTAEIGVRIALGASRTKVTLMFVHEAAWLVIPGLVAGAAVSVAATRLLRSLLYETNPLDPLVAGIGIVAISLSAAVASWLPAQRASRVDPIQALRAE